MGWPMQGDEVWWRLKCKDLDHEGLPVNNTGTGWAHCGQTLQDGPRSAYCFALCLP